MTRVNRYDSRVMKPRQSYFEGVRFDSDFELNVYKHIRLYYEQSEIACHHPLSIFPATDAFPELQWKVDFMVTTERFPKPILIEAKGVVTQEFKLILQALAYQKRWLIPQLIIVHNTPGIRLGKRLITTDLTGLADFLRYSKTA